jgi:Flp pilus assembly protein TadD
MIDYLSSLNLMDLVEKALSNILDKTIKEITILKAKIHIYNKRHQEALTILNKYLDENKRDYEIHLLKGTLCYETEQFYEAEETFLKAL